MPSIEDKQNMHNKSNSGSRLKNQGEETNNRVKIKDDNMLMYGRNQHNIVIILQLKINKFKKIIA